MTIVCRLVDARSCVACLNCAGRFLLGATAIEVHCVGELLGHVCRGCLADETQAQLAALERSLRMRGGR